MTYHPPIGSWRLVANHLPFSLEDTCTVNRHFSRWSHRGGIHDKWTIDLWSYCYICRYFLVKYTLDEALHKSDIDLLVGEAFTRVQRNLQGVRSPDRFTHWVSVVCKNTLINYTRQQASYISLHGANAFDLLPSTPEDHLICHDIEVAYGTLSNAIRRLPRFLRVTARLRLLRRLTYQQISEETGQSVATARTYTHKAINHIRKDPEMQALRDELL